MQPAIPDEPAGFVERPSAGLAPNAALQAIDGDDDIRPLKDLHQPIQKSFGIMRSRLKVFLKHTLRVAHSLKG
jgi:hypothetical protein